jgi:hypothetical protein
MTDSQGGFEFTFPAADTSKALGTVSGFDTNRPYALQARKPGFLPELNDSPPNLQLSSTKEVRISLAPVSLQSYKAKTNNLYKCIIEWFLPTFRW